MASKAYEERVIAPTGRGLFATKDLHASAIILQDAEPLMAVLDSPLLTKACAWCFTYLEEVEPEVNVRLSACSGCKILRYCGKACQSASWKHSHKYECKIYKDLYPQVLPNTVRMLHQLLLRRKANALPPSSWSQFLSLTHHTSFVQSGASSANPNQPPNHYLSSTWDNLQLIARAAHDWIKPPEPLPELQTFVSRLLTNTQTLTTPLFTPLGLILSLRTSLLNHSCSPNTAITYSNRLLTLRALYPIKKGSELTISYIDPTLPLSTRLSELQNRYNFTCACSQCSASKTLNHPDPHPTLGALATQPSLFTSLQANVSELLSQARAVNAQAALTPLAKAYQLFKPYPSFPPFLSPLQQVRLDLTIALMANGYFTAALIQSLITRYKSDPIVYPVETHPARIARAWVHARLVGQVGHLANGTPESESDGVGREGRSMEGPKGERGQGGEIEAARALARKFGIEWGLVVWTMVSGVSKVVLKSHGVESGLSREVGREMGRLREEVKISGRGEPGGEEVEGCKVILKRVAEEGWDWWRGWEGEKRSRGKMLVTKGGEGEDGVGVLLE